MSDKCQLSENGTFPKTAKCLVFLDFYGFFIHYSGEI